MMLNRSRVARFTALETARVLLVPDECWNIPLRARGSGLRDRLSKILWPPIVLTYELS
jgi:hypothetical protein